MIVYSMLCAYVFKDDLSDEEEQAAKEDSAERVGIHDQSSTPSRSDVRFIVILSNN